MLAELLQFLEQASTVFGALGTFKEFKDAGTRKSAANSLVQLYKILGDVNRQSADLHAFLHRASLSAKLPLLDVLVEQSRPLSSSFYDFGSCPVSVRHVFRWPAHQAD